MDREVAVARLFDRPETFIGWRYLFRRRRSRAILAITLVLGVAAVALPSLFLFVNWTAGGIAQSLVATFAVASLMFFTTFLFLNFFSVFTTISMTGVFWGVAALTTVLAVTTGFQDEFQRKVLGVNAHIIVMKYGLDFNEWREIAAKVEQVPHIQKPVAPFVFNEMMIAHGPALSGVLVKGVQPARASQVLDINMIAGAVGSLDHPPKPAAGPQLPSALIGKELAKKLRAKVGDTVRVISPLGGLDPSLWTAEGKAPKMREFQVTGIFYSGFDEYDRRLVYIALPEAQAFLEGGDVVTGVEMKIDDIYRSRDVAREVDKALGGPPYRTIDWRELNHNLFTALRLQKLVLAVLLFIIVLVALFGVIATMTMLVIDKAQEIAIIKSLGMRSSGVAGTFIAAGMTIGALGTGAGIALGLAICGLLSRFSYRLDPRVYLIDRLPVKIQVTELSVIALVTLAACFAFTLIPSLRAAHLRPVEGLRYE
ncbi:MAG: ABC transporter permease [Myxococcales bacterium]|nr:ABC transporter permease [Myxococcales bacterium]